MESQMEHESPFAARKLTRRIQLKNFAIGGGAPVSVQSMTNTDTRDIEATVEQIRALEEAGCEIVRLAVPDMEAARALRVIAEKTGLPVVADIHFDYRLALAALESGAHCLRINPGNIGGKENVDAVVDAAKAAGAAIRIGVNGGSLEKDLLLEYGGPRPEALVKSALRHLSLLEKRGFYNTKVSLKSSSVADCISAYRLLSSKADYPLHIGVTEAGGLVRGAVKSAVGLGLLLAEGIGDTMRVSLTADPVAEMPVAYEILRALGLRDRGPEIISCPTCGRTEIDLFSLAGQVEQRLQKETAKFKVAVMGCVVNGPGEAREADIGLAGGRDKGVIFLKGEIVRSVQGREALLTAFMEELEKFLSDLKNKEMQ